MIKLLKYLILLFFININNSHAWTKLGLVKIVKAESILVSNKGKESNIKLNNLLKEGDIIKTNSSGYIGIIFNDGSVLSLGPKSILRISHYEFDVINLKVSSIFNLEQGTLSYASGAINRVKPGSVLFNTPNGDITLFGTKLLLEVN